MHHLHTVYTGCGGVHAHCSQCTHSCMQGSSVEWTGEPLKQILQTLKGCPHIALNTDMRTDVSIRVFSEPGDSTTQEPVLKDIRKGPGSRRNPMYSSVPLPTKDFQLPLPPAAHKPEMEADPSPNTAVLPLKARGFLLLLDLEMCAAIVTSSHR